MGNSQNLFFFWIMCLILGIYC